MERFIPFSPVIDANDPGIRAQLEDRARSMGQTLDETYALYARSLEKDDHFRNTEYTVCVREHYRGITQLSVYRNDGEPVRSWKDMQVIKNTFLGTECEAVELYPAESRLVDTAPNYHLWGYRDGRRFDLGFERGRVVSGEDHTPEQVS